MNPSYRRDELRSLIRGHEVEEDREVGDGEVKVPLEDGAVCLKREVLVIQGRAKKNLAKLSDNCSVRAEWMCIGSPRLVGERKAGYSNMQQFFCTTLYCSIFALLLNST